MKNRRLLLEHVDVPGIEGIDVYVKQGGYATLEKALKKMSPDEVVRSKEIWSSRPRRRRISYRDEMVVFSKTRRCSALFSMQR